MKHALYALALLASASSASAANLVVNPGFETSNFFGWTVSGDTTGVGVFPATQGYAHSGNYGAGLFSRAALSHIDQLIPTLVGHAYDVSFYLEAGDAGLASNYFQSTFGGATVTAIIDSPGINYTRFAGVFTATNTSTLLSFSSINRLSVFGLDDVDVTDLGRIGGAVPEPASWALMITGFGMVGAAQRRRTRAFAA